jgi:Tfp pilus assembly protein PilZ
MGFPIFYIVGSMLLFDLPAAACVSILLSPRFYVLSTLAVAAGYGFWEMKHWAWYFFVIVNILVAYQNMNLANDYGTSQHPAVALLCSWLAIGLLTLRVAREVRVPYFFPKIRWWESDPRYRLSVPVMIRRQGIDEVQADILDLSLGGCFIKIRSEVGQDESVELSFAVFGIEIQCAGTVVWRTKSTVTHPKGVGIKFSEMDRTQRRALRMINGRLKKIAQFYKKSRYLLNQEDFLKRLQELEAPAGRGEKAEQAG